MHRAFVLFAGLGFALLACGKTDPIASPRRAPPPAVAEVDAAIATDAGFAPDEAAAPTARAPGPYEVPFRGTRKVWVGVAKAPAGKQRLLVNLHGMCNPPGYACGYWLGAGTDRGFMVCPEGNTTCGAGGPSSWDESFAEMDRDLEAAIALVDATWPGEIVRDGAVLTAFSRGAYAAPIIAGMHPGRWPYLILAEADVSLSAAQLKKAGVRAVVLLAGELGTQIAGERATVKRLQAEKFPARFVPMKNAGHYYSADIDALMADAIDWVVSVGEIGGATVD